jgi:hypothetical protein
VPAGAAGAGRVLLGDEFAAMNDSLLPRHLGVSLFQAFPFGIACIRIVHWIVQSMHLKHHHLDPDFAWSYLSDTVAAGSTGSTTHGGVK